MRLKAEWSEKAKELRSALSSRVVSQSEAIDTVTRVYEMFLGGLSDPHRPIASLLFLGPTGVGKTWLVEVLAEFLFDNREAALKIHCGEYQHSHEIAKLIGAPPGYLGHRETDPELSQAKLEKFWKQGYPEISLLLFDEIEKAHRALFDLLLGGLESGVVVLGNASRVNLARSIVFMTSNLGARDIADTELKFGFRTVPADPAKVTKIATEAARKHFSPEFFNRLTSVVVFSKLSKAQMNEVLNLELRRVQDRILASPAKFIVKLLPSAREFLLSEGTDERYGARPMRRAIEKNVTAPLSSLVASGQLKSGDTVCVGWEKSQIYFDRAFAA
jgi:ATP-dependent Clp protease ATP-binding subunit ClpB